MEEIKDLQLDPNYYAVVANAIIRGKQRMTLREMQLIQIAISQIVKEDNELFTYRTTPVELAEFLGISKSSLYRDLDEITDNLMKRIIRINVNGSLEKFQWVSYCKYDTKSKEITIKLHDHLKPYLLELNKLYSQIPLKITSNFKSYYTLRLYQLLKCEYGEKRKTAFTFNLDEIREFFQIEDSKYRNTKDLIRYTIKSAVDELNESDFCIITNYEEIRARTRGTPLKGVKFSAILCDSKKEKDNKILELKTKAAIESIMKSKEE